MLEAHIQLDKSVNAKYAIMPGDPAPHRSRYPLP